MKFNLKMIAAAVAMIAAGSANAALSSGYNTGNGSVALYAFNTVTGAYYIRDTGFLLNQFVPSSVTTLAGDGGVTGDKTPATGLTLNPGNTASFADATFSTWLTGQTTTDVSWALVGGDSLSSAAGGVSRMLTTGATSGLTFTNGQVTNASAGANVGNIVSLGTAGGTFSATAGAPTWMAVNGGLTGTLTTLGSGASLYYIARSAATGPAATAASTVEFGNAAGFAVVTLALNGDLSYVLAPEAVSAVPVPAAAWMLGSGLMALGGMVRRRRAAAQA